MEDFALGWKIVLFIVELIIFVIVAVKSASLLKKEEPEFLADEKKKA